MPTKRIAGLAYLLFVLLCLSAAAALADRPGFQLREFVLD